MVKTYIYISDELHERVMKAAKEFRMSKAEVMRHCMEEGIVVFEEEDASIKVEKKVKQSSRILLS